jgi:hypothetical protein
MSLDSVAICSSMGPLRIPTRSEQPWSPAEPTSTSRSHPLAQNHPPSAHNGSWRDHALSGVQLQYRETVSTLDKSVQKGILHSNGVFRY